MVELRSRFQEMEKKVVGRQSGLPRNNRKIAAELRKHTLLQSRSYGATVFLLFLGSPGCPVVICFLPFLAGSTEARPFLAFHATIFSLFFGSSGFSYFFTKNGAILPLVLGDPAVHTG